MGERLGGGGGETGRWRWDGWEVRSVERWTALMGGRRGGLTRGRGRGAEGGAEGEMRGRRRGGGAGGKD